MSVVFYPGLHFEGEKRRPNFRKTRSPIVENPASVKNGYLRTGSIYFPWPFTTIADWLRLINVSTQDCCQMAQPRSFHFPDHWAMLGSQTNIRIPALRYFWRVAPASGSPGDRAPASAGDRHLPPRLERAAPACADTRSHRDVLYLSCCATLFGAIRVWAQLGLRAPRVCRRTDILKNWIPYASKPSSDRGCHKVAPLALWS